MNRKLELKLKQLENERSELLVLIDTLQTNLRSSISELDTEQKLRIESVQSCKWSLNWRPDNLVKIDIADNQVQSSPELDDYKSFL